MRDNCLTYALERWNRRGGYLVIRKSDHWAMPHVLHSDADGLHHFVPPRELDSPAVALFGFDGEAHSEDIVPASPMPLRGIVIGGWGLAITVTMWAAWAVCRRIASRWGWK